MFALTLVWRFLTFTGFSNDHYAHLALAQQTLLGDRPIRDFSDPGWPLTYLVSAAASLAAGDAMVTEWTIVALALAAAAACTVIAAYRLSGSIAIAIVVALLEILIYPRTYSYPKLLTYVVAACALLAVAAKPSWRRIAGTATVIALAFLFRHDHGLYIGVPSAVCVALASWPDGLAAALRRAAVLTTLTALFLLPWTLFVSMNGGLFAYFDRALEYARAEANASVLKSWPTPTFVEGQPLFGLAPARRPLAQIIWTADTPAAGREALERRYGLEFVRQAEDGPLYYVHDPSAETMRALAEDPHVAGTSGLGRAQRPAWRELLAQLSPLRLAPALHTPVNADAWLFWLFWTLPVLATLVLAMRLVAGTARSPGETAAVAALILMALFVNAGFLRDILRTRFSDAIVPAVLLGSWLLGLVWLQPWRRRALQAATRAITILVLFLTLVTAGYVAELPERVERTAVLAGWDAVRTRATHVAGVLRGPHRQTAMPPSRYAEALMPFFSYVDRCSSPHDRLVVIGEFPDLVVLARRRFASDGAVFGAWYSSAVHQDDTVARLASKPALFALQIDEDENFRSRFPLIAAHFDRELRPMTTIDVPGAGRVLIRVEARRSPVGVDSDTGWPCFR
jgi:hypothetical protein